jgi:hypothetical protein
MVEWGATMGAGGFAPPSYIVKKCPETFELLIPEPGARIYSTWVSCILNDV